jgi:site-specific DNA recombinase
MRTASKHYRYYVCSHAKKRGRNTCSTPPLNAHEIEQTVVEHICQISAHPEMMRTVLEKTNAA